MTHERLVLIEEWARALQPGSSVKDERIRAMVRDLVTEFRILQVRREIEVSDQMRADLGDLAVWFRKLGERVEKLEIALRDHVVENWHYPKMRGHGAAVGDERPAPPPKAPE